MRSTITAPLLALAAAAGLPATAQADRSDCPRKLERSYSHHWHKVANVHGKRQPGRNIRRQGMRVGHGAWRPARCHEIRRSLRTFKRWLAPPPAPVARGDRAPGWGQTSPVNTGGGYAIPSGIVMCESGGSYSAYNPSSGAYGAYQIIPSTAAAFGCDLSSPAGQDQCAGRIWRGQGRGAWSC